jgi:hypothetical protein
MWLSWMTIMLESAIERQLCERVKALGGICVKTRAIGRRGFFDRLVLLPGGKVWFVELKRPRGGRLSPHQAWYLKTFTELGAAVMIIKSPEQIDQLLNSR